MTKTAVAALVLLLAEDGRLGLDDPADRRGGAPAGITVRQLLQHTSGLPDYAANPGVRERYVRDATAVWHPEELLEFAGRRQLVLVRLRTPTRIMWYWAS